MRERLAVVRTLGALGLVGLFAVGAGCRRSVDLSPDPGPAESRVPATAAGAGQVEETGLPLGYPDALPLVPGGRAVGGGIDPGVIRIATLVYANHTVSSYVEALKVALVDTQATLVRDDTTSTGSHHLRVRLPVGHANLIVTDEAGHARVDVSMMEPRDRR